MKLAAKATESETSGSSANKHVVDDGQLYANWSTIEWRFKEINYQ